MENPQSNLKKWLEGAERVAVLAVGSRLRGDDAAGLLAAEELAKLMSSSIVHRPSSIVKIFMGETTPENLTGEMRRFNPTHLIVLDAADVDEDAGDFRILDPADVAGMSASTHNLPMNVLTNYLQQSIGCAVILIGIQPANCGLGQDVSAEVSAGAKRLAQAIADALPS